MYKSNQCSRIYLYRYCFLYIFDGELFTNNVIYQFTEIIYNIYFSSSLYNVSWVQVCTKVISIVAYICTDIVSYIFSMVKKWSEIFKTRPHNIMQVATAYNHKCGYLLVFIFLNIDGTTSTGTKWKLEKKMMHPFVLIVDTNTGLAPFFGGPPWEIASTMGHWMGRYLFWYQCF